MAPFKRYERLSEIVKMYPCFYNKQKNFKKKKEEAKQRAWKEKLGKTSRHVQTLITTSHSGEIKNMIMIAHYHENL